REPEPRGLRGQEAEGREGVVVARAAHRGNGVRDRHVLAAGYVVIAQAVGSDGDTRDLGRPRLRFPIRAVIRVAGDDRPDQAEAPRCLLPRSRRPRQQREPLDGASRRARRSRSTDPRAAPPAYPYSGRWWSPGPLAPARAHGVRSAGTRTGGDHPWSLD